MKRRCIQTKAKGLLRPGLDNTRLFISLTAGAGTRFMILLSSSPSLSAGPTIREEDIGPALGLGD
jgi:hypothetical protein